MILVVDVGNTNIVVGAYRGADLVCSWRLSTSGGRTADEIGVFLYAVLEKSGFSKGDVKDCIISSVVPDVMYALTHAFEKYFNRTPAIVSHTMRMHIHLRGQESPEAVGADRLVNCEAAFQLYGGPVIVIDYGTATTYDVVDHEAVFLTGITAPGVKICAEALFQKASLLNKVELVLPSSIIARNTTESVQAGIVFGHIGETEYIVGRLKNELSIPDAKVVATGGLARIIAQGTAVFDVVNPNLTLEGLRLLYEMNLRTSG